MADYRLIELDSVRRISRLLEQVAAEAQTISSDLLLQHESSASTVARVARSAHLSSRHVLMKADAAEPGGGWADRSTCLNRYSTSGDSLQSLIRSNRARALEELWLVASELNRFAGLGFKAGPLFNGLRQDYDTLTRLIGMNLVYFAVDSSAPIGTRSSRAGYRAGVWIGPADANHVLVMIPGMSTTTHSWLESNVPDAERLQDQTSRLADREGQGSVAIVPLLSYSPPRNILEAPLGRFWRDGSKETAAALASIPLDNRHVVGWGHSYGAAVLGATAAIGGVFDDLIMVGAAGTGTETLEELGVTSEHLFVATNWNDPIRLVPNDYHGVNPVTLPHTAIPTAPATDFDPWKAIFGIPWLLIDGLPDHDYLEDEIAMRAFAALTIGLDDLSDR
ncbi:MAG: alpha/beta hydrolase family protein [Acidimicrobiia bacterium]|nr:alpha/beta hydrolase family protein [Acidimicrobiia bacterium]